MTVDPAKMIDHLGKLLNPRMAVFISLLAVLTVFTTILLASQSRLSWTVDEFRWIQAGKLTEQRGWTGHPDEISHPVLFMASHAGMRRLLSDGTQQSDVFFSRLGLLPYQLAGMIILFIWARRCHGLMGAIVATGFLSLSPTYLAHAQLANSDGMLAVAVLATAAAIAGFLRKPTLRNSALLAACFTFGMLSKFSFLLIPVVVPFIILLTPGGVGLRFRRLATGWLFPLLTALLMLNLVYGFKGTGKPLHSIGFESESMDRLASGVTGNIRIPVPERYIRGMDVHMVFLQRWPGFMLGRISETGFAGYDAFAFLVKTTLPALLLILISLISLVKVPISLDETIGLVVSLFWLLNFSLFCRVDCGVRFVLPIYPLLFFFAARIVNFRMFKTMSGRTVPLLLLAIHAFSALHAYPFFLSYFNCAAGGSSRGYLLLGDSNLSWAHDLKELQRFQERSGIEQLIFGLEERHPILDPYITYRPITHREKYFPSTGDYAIWIASLQMLIQNDPNAFLWFRLIQPEEILADTVYLYHIEIKPGDELSYLRESLQATRSSGSRFPWADHWLETTGYRLFFPLQAVPGDHRSSRFEFTVDHAPPTCLLTVSPREMTAEVSVLYEDGSLSQPRYLAVSDDSGRWFAIDSSLRAIKVFITPAGEQERLPEVCLVYDLAKASSSVPGLGIQRIAQTVTEKIQP